MKARQFVVIVTLLSAIIVLLSAIFVRMPRQYVCGQCGGVSTTCYTVQGQDGKLKNVCLACYLEVRAEDYARGEE